jgi:phosphoribosyl 1,2-cyclic phosphate phosphodiesterase
MQITILGSGNSSGTPALDYGWGKCDPANPRNRRLRPSILVSDGDIQVLVDTSPDLREQALRADIHQLDAVIFTHAHADHLHGIDDLRPLNRAMKRAIDIYADQPTLAEIQRRFGYVLEPLSDGNDSYYKPVLIPHEIAAGEQFHIRDMPITVFGQDHGFGETLGLRFGPFAYSTDVTGLDEAAFGALDGVRLWVIGTLTEQPHPTHAHVEKALEWIERVGPERAVLTRLSASLDYETLRAKLPGNVQPAFDGMVLEVA